MRNNRKPWRGSGYFCFMMSTTSVANATIKYIASNVDTIPPPSWKEVANRSPTACYAYYSIIFQAEKRKFYELLSHCHLSNEGGFFIFPPRSSRLPRCRQARSFPPPAYSFGRGIKGVGALERSRAVWCRRRPITSRLVKGPAVAAYPPINLAAP